MKDENELDMKKERIFFVIDLFNAIICLAIIVGYITKSIVYGFITYFFFGSGVYGIFFTKSAWHDLDEKKYKLLIISIGFILTGLVLIIFKFSGRGR